MLLPDKKEKRFNYLTVKNNILPGQLLLVTRYLSRTATERFFMKWNAAA